MGLRSLLQDGVPAMLPELGTWWLLAGVPCGHRLSHCSGGMCRGSCRVPWQGVQVDTKGHVVVDEYQNTTRRGVYAIGDVCGRALLTPGAAAVPPRPSPSVPRRAAAQAPRPSPQWPSRLAESWPTGSLRASRTPAWTTTTSPPSSSATRPSAPWASPKVGRDRAWRGWRGWGRCGSELLV